MSIKLQQLFLRYRDELQEFLRQRVSCPDTAADLAQEAFLRVLDNPASTSGHDIRAQLFRTAADLASGQQRADDMARSFAAQQAGSDVANGSAEQQVLSTEELDVMRQAIDDLPRVTRQVFIMHKFDHLGYADIARALGIPKNKVTVHMARALAYCRHCLDEHRRC